MSVAADIDCGVLSCRWYNEWKCRNAGTTLQLFASSHCQLQVGFGEVSVLELHMHPSPHTHTHTPRSEFGDSLNHLAAVTHVGYRFKQRLSGSCVVNLHNGSYATLTVSSWSSCYSFTFIAFTPSHPHTCTHMPSHPHTSSHMHTHALTSSHMQHTPPHVCAHTLSDDNAR